MRNVKKFLALVLAMLMVVSAAATVSAFEDVADDHAFAAAINDLTVKEIVNGYDGETFGPDDAVTRQQMALMMARAITGNVGDDAVWAQGGLVGFEDVTEYQYAIATVVKAGIVDGFLDNTFRPEEGITFVQALKMAVCALGYDDGNLAWWQGYYNVALDLGLTENLNYITDADKALNRGEVAQLIYNMLYVELADGSDCFASQNFGLATAENVTTFAIVATPKQCATETTGVAEGGYVGLQEIVNGVPAGDIAYIAIDEFDEFDADTVEDYFGYAYNFVNWNDGEYDDIIATGTVDKIYNTEITESGSKFTYDGKNYYPVEALTGTPIRNEVVIYNANNHEYVHTAKLLLLDKEGEVWLDMDGDGIEDELALKAVYSVNGEIISYRDYYAGDYDATTGLYAKKVGYLDEAKATAKYGVDVESGVDALEFLTVATLAGAYELTIFDDDMDGKMDRAYYTPVYVNAHETTLSGGTKYQYGPMYGKTSTTFVDEDGEAVTLADGQVYKYTYNSQLNQVTVLDTYEAQIGTLNRINTLRDYNYSGNQNADWYAVKLTIDGEVYVLGNTYREVQGIDGFTINKNGIGYRTDLVEVANINGKTSEGNTWSVTSNSSIGYTYHNNSAFDKLTVGSLVRFVAVEDTILIVEEFDIMDSYELVVLEEAIDFDTEAVYLDLWMNGEIVEEVAVTKIWDESSPKENKYVEIADLNYFKLNTLLTQVFNSKAGYIYRAVPTAEGYQISKAFVNAKADRVGSDKASTTATLKTNDYGLVFMCSGDGDDLVFTDGIGDTDLNNTVDVLRTNNNTLFYFINKNTNDVYAYVGSPADGATIKNLGVDDDNVQVYANKLGFSSKISSVSGVASTVVVYYNNANEIKGFGLTNIGEKVIYVSEKNYTSWDQHGRTAMEPYDYGTAADFGLGKEYDGNIYYYYNKQVAIDMHTGAFVSQIFTEDMYLEPGTFYVLSADNVVIDTLDVITKDSAGNIVSFETADKQFTVVAGTATATTITAGRKWTGTGLFSSNKIDTVYMISNAADFTTSSNRKSSETAIAGLFTATRPVWYLPADEEDAIFVGVVDIDGANASAPVAGQVTIVVNAAWGEEQEKAANFDYTETDGKVTGTVTLINDARTSWNASVTSIKVPFGAATYEMTDIALAGVTGLNLSDYVCTATVVDGCLNISVSAAVKTPLDTGALAAGSYTLTIGNSVNEIPLVVYFIVDAAE